MLTSPQASVWQPFARRAKVRTSGWHLSPDLCKSGVKQVDGVLKPVHQTDGRSQNEDEGNLTPARGDSENWSGDMSFVFVVDQQQRPMDPVHPGRARFLLSAGHAAVWRRYPFTLILKDQSAEASPPTPLRLKIDPGSKTTGLALANDTTGQVVWAGELTHRGQQVTKRLDHRRACRRSRRRRHTRYRAARFLNRRRPEGWLPPSLESRLANVLTWVRRLQRICCIGALSQELVRFDMQLLQNPDIAGEEYQHGTLAGYELREYVLETMGRRCVYCGKENVPLQLDHLLPRSRNGPTRASNLAPACVPCNQEKGNRTAAEFGHPQVESRANVPLHDAAAV